MNKSLIQPCLGIFIAAALGLGGRTAPAQTMTNSSLTGAVTEVEISSFVNYLATQSPPTTNTYDNTLADGTAGMQAEALGLMYEVTNDPALLNEMIVYADAFMAARNDLETTGEGGQRVMWDGHVDPVWLTYPASSGDAGYAGCENNDIAGHIAYCAKLILETPARWNSTVPDGNPHGYGATYYERATNYVDQLEYAEANYFNKYFINPANDEIVAPTNAAWTAFDESVTAWNRQMMFLSGWQRLAECHELLNNNASTVALYDSVVQASINWFFDESASGLSSYSTNSHTVYDWDYAPLSGGTEDMSLHADYDMWGLNRAYLSGRYSLTQPQMYYFGNTLQYAIYLGSDTFADYVTGGSANGTRNYIYPAWTLVSQFDPLDYYLTSGANIAQGSQKDNAIFDAFIEWVKNANYTGRFASNTNATDFSLVAPWIETVTTGSNVTGTVTLSTIDGFDSSVTLGAQGLPAGVTASFNPATVTGAGTSTMTLSASGSATAGIYAFGSLAITGSGGSLTRISPLTLNVLSRPNFFVSASPSSQNITIGAGTSFTVTVGSLNGFSGTVALSVSGLPTHASSSFSPASVTGGAGSSTLSITTATNTPNGTYTLTLMGVSGTLTNSTTVSLELNDFTVSVSPASQTVTAGGSTNYTVTVGNVNGFAGTVGLSAGGLPSGATASFNPSSIDALGSSTMTISTLGTEASSTNTLTIIGTSGSLQHRATATLVVNTNILGGGRLPAGWTDSDIGAVGLAGSASDTSNVFTIAGSGADIFGTNDEFNYCRLTITNNFTVTAYVSSQNATNSWAKSGVMIRGSASTNSAYIGVYITPRNGVDMQCRTVNGAEAVDMARVAGVAAPYWVRLVRSGNTLTGYCAPDGVTWTEVGSTNISMAASVRAGLAVCAHSNTSLNTSTFTDVSAQ
jgi:regulation of enolase protein 1 (concanavalin A-like superfamily)